MFDITYESSGWQALFSLKNKKKNKLSSIIFLGTFRVRFHSDHTRGSIVCRSKADFWYSKNNLLTAVNPIKK